MNHFLIHHLLEPLWFSLGNLFDNVVDLETQALNLLIPLRQHFSGFKVHEPFNLIDMSVHSTFCYHLAGNSLCFSRRDFQEGTKLSKCNVVVELAGRE